ncbi:MAG TPA: LCP family protein [Candidatus Limnocylindria bacterium]|nr:LCP family protein [Candidatus Limnocylindria bacterium]
MTDVPGTPALPPELDPRGNRRSVPSRARGLSVPTVAAGVAAALVLVVSGGGWLALDQIDRRLDKVDVGISGGGGSIADSAQTILLVGSDNREGLTKKQIRQLHVGAASATNGAGRRSDTMILMHLSKERDQVTMVSLPRDSLVKIPAWTDSQGTQHRAEKNKLNAAFAFGGPALAIDTIEANTGVRIDHYVEVDFAGFAGMVDALGGVEVCMKKPVKDSKSGLDLPKGTSTLDGAQGLAFVRARYFDPRADIGRIERQQKFLGAMFRKATASEVLLNPVALSSFLDAALKSVKTDKGITRDDILALAARLRQVAAGNVAFLTPPIADYDYRDGVHGSSVRWDAAAAAELFRKIEADEVIVPPAAPVGQAGPSVAPGAIKVQVLNGAGIAGLARTAAEDLATVGFAIAGAPANAATTGAPRTVIAYDPKYDESVKTLAAALPGAQLKAVPGQGDTFQVILGTDYAGATTPVVTAKSDTGGADVQTAANKRCA